MALTFKERLALAAAAGTHVVAKEEVVDARPTPAQASAEPQTTVEAPATKPSRFGGPAVTTTAPKPTVVPTSPSRFGIPIGSPALNPLGEEPFKGQADRVAALTKEKEPEGLSLGMVIAAHNTIANQPSGTGAENADAEALSGTDAPSVVKELQQRISQLSTLEGMDLKGETGLLKEMITANGDACRYLLPEDLGLMVRALRRMTDNKVAQDMTRAKPAKGAAASSKTPTLNASDVANLLGELDLSL